MIINSKELFNVAHTSYLYSALTAVLYSRFSFNSLEATTPFLDHLMGALPESFDNEWLQAEFELWTSGHINDNERILSPEEFWSVQNRLSDFFGFGIHVSRTDEFHHIWQTLTGKNTEMSGSWQVVITGVVDLYYTLKAWKTLKLRKSFPRREGHYRIVNIWAQILKKAEKGNSCFNIIRAILHTPADVFIQLFTGNGIEVDENDSLALERIKSNLLALFKYSREILPIDDVKFYLSRCQLTTGSPLDVVLLAMRLINGKDELNRISEEHETPANEQTEKVTEVESTKTKRMEKGIFKLPDNFFSIPKDLGKRAEFFECENDVEDGGPSQLSDLINWLSSEGFIEADDRTKRRLAYVLTGHDRPDDFNPEEKFIWKDDKGNELCYLIKTLIVSDQGKKFSKYDKMCAWFVGPQWKTPVKDLANNAKPKFMKRLRKFYPTLGSVSQATIGAIERH